MTFPAIDLEHVITYVDLIDNPEDMTTEEYRAARERYDGELHAAAAIAYPDETWCLTEPDRDRLLVDRDGMIWAYEPEVCDEDGWEIGDGSGWRRRCARMIGVDGTYLGVPLPEDWDEVLDYGPIRVWRLELDGDPIWRYLYWSEWRNGGGVGEATVLTSPVAPSGVRS